MAIDDVSSRGVGEGFDTAVGMPGAGGELQTFVIQMADGTVYEAISTAEELGAVVGGLSSERYIRLGDTVVRCDDVRAVYVGNSGVGARSGDGGTSRGYGMSTMHQGTSYDQERSYGGDSMPRMSSSRQRGWADGWGETKGSPKTTELLAVLLGTLAIAICAAVFDNFGVWQAMILITGLLGAYMLSRGIAKAGTSHHEQDRR